MRHIIVFLAVGGWAPLWAQDASVTNSPSVAITPPAVTAPAAPMAPANATSSNAAPTPNAPATANAAPSPTDDQPTPPTPLVLPAADKLFNVMDHGAKADGTTDDAGAIQATIDAAAAAGDGAMVYLPAGRYCLSSPGPDHRFYFVLPPNAHGLTFTGDPGKTVLLTAGGRCFFVADHCKNCTIENLTVDFKNLNVTQGTIAAADASARTVTVRLDSGYPTPDSDVFAAPGGRDSIFFILSTGRNTFNWETQLPILSLSASGDQWVFQLAHPVDAKDVGKRFFLWGKQQPPWTPFVELRGCSGLTVKNIMDYAGGGFSGGGVGDPIHFDNFYCGPPPGSNRLGFFGGHQGHSRADVVMTNCQLLMSNDDDMNELTPLRAIIAQPIPDTIEVRDGSEFQRGDSVSIWDYADINVAYVRDQAVIQQMSRQPDGSMKLVLDKDVTLGRIGRQEGLRGDLDHRDRVVDTTSGGKFTLINCSFSASFAHPLLLKTSKGLDIEGCRIYGSDMSGLDCGMQTYWNEGPQTCNVTLKNNTFFDNDGISCRIGIEVPKGTDSKSHDQLNIDIEGNRFLSGGNHPAWNRIMPRGVALLIGNVHQATVRNNVFAGFPNANIVVYSSDQVTIENNVFLNAHGAQNESDNWKDSAKIDPYSVISISDAAQVKLAGNVDFAEGPYGRDLVNVGAATSDIQGADTGLAAAQPVKPTSAAMLDAEQIASGPGAGYIAGLNHLDSSVEFTISVPQAGLYPVVVTFNNARTGADGLGLAAAQRMVVNGDDASAVTVDYPYTGTWGAYHPDFVTLAWANLKAGPNKLRFDHSVHSAEIQGIVIPVKP